MSNLDRVLDAAMDLPLEQQEILVKILTNRIIESRRDEIASDAAPLLNSKQVGSKSRLLLKQFKNYGNISITQVQPMYRLVITSKFKILLSS
ncbi:hypothetical protein [Nostoc sp.]